MVNVKSIRSKRVTEKWLMKYEKYFTTRSDLISLRRCPCMWSPSTSSSSHETETRPRCSSAEHFFIYDFNIKHNNKDCFSCLFFGANLGQYMMETRGEREKNETKFMLERVMVRRHVWWCKKVLTKGTHSHCCANFMMSQKAFFSTFCASFSAHKLPACGMENK